MKLFIFTAGLIMKAHGLAILTVAKIGFLVTARGGSGIVIAKLPQGGNVTEILFFQNHAHLMNDRIKFLGRHWAEILGSVVPFCRLVCTIGDRYSWPWWRL